MPLRSIPSPFSTMLFVPRLTYICDYIGFLAPLSLVSFSLMEAQARDGKEREEWSQARDLLFSRPLFGAILD